MYIIVSGTVRAVGGTTMTLQEMRQEEYAKTIKIAGKGAGRHFSTIGKLPGQKRSLPAGVSFGEGALLMPGAVADSTYRAASSGCTLLEVPRTYFYQMIGKDLTLVSALHIKLLRNILLYNNYIPTYTYNKYIIIQEVQVEVWSHNVRLYRSPPE